jgi:hypothetical protein
VACRLHPSVVDQDINAVPLFQDLLDHGLDGHLQGHVGDIVTGQATCGGDAPKRLIQVDWGNVVDG